MNGEPHMPSAALFYGGAGVNVFPVNAEKEPLTGRGGFKLATTDRGQIERWWTEHPEAGIATPDYDVVDVDLYKPECKSTWERIRPLIPEGTPHNRTGRGGLQFFFAPGTLKDGKIGPGVDSRYAGRSYVILPPSRNEGGYYETVVSVFARRPMPAPDFPRESGSNSEFNHLREQMDAGAQITDGRNKAAWWRAVEILRTLPNGTALDPVVGLVQSWVNTNCGGNLAEVDVPKQVRGAATFVAGEREGRHARPHDADGPVFIDLRDVEMRDVRWIDKPFLPMGELVTNNADGDTGKGLMAVHWAARTSRGEFGEPRLCVFCVSEDDFETVLKPRLVAAGANLEHIRGLHWRHTGRASHPRRRPRP